MTLGPGQAGEHDVSDHIGGYRVLRLAVAGGIVEQDVGVLECRGKLGRRKGSIWLVFDAWT